jgi:hypothetical protein
MQYQLLAPTTDAARSMTVNVGALGAALSLFAADNKIDADTQAFVELSVNGSWRPYTRLGETVILTRDVPTMFVQGPGKYSIRKQATLEPVGVVGDRGAEDVSELVERGQLFGCSPLVQVPPSGVASTMLVTGAGVLTQVFLSVIAEYKMYLDTYPVSGFSTSGFDVPILNYYVQHPNRPKAFVSTNPGQPVKGPRIDRALCEVSGKDGVNGMVIGNKIILPPSTMWLFEFVNRAQQAGEASVILRFFETPTETENGQVVGI